MQKHWSNCCKYLEGELTPEEYATWIQPLQLSTHNDGSTLCLFAPNVFVRDQVQEQYGALISGWLKTRKELANLALRIDVGSNRPRIESNAPIEIESPQPASWTCTLNSKYTFANYIQGKSNDLARAASMQVSEGGDSHPYNPLFIYGGTGLGKTHLMHAIGNEMLRMDPRKKIVYVHSEAFVNEMINSLQHNAIERFKQKYRSLDALLIDDIQFFGGKEKSQEELFHTFNALLDANQQIVLCCDRYPKEIEGLEDRLKSRFGWGLTVAVDPPDLETRVAILKSKAEQFKADLPDEVGFFIAQRVQSHVRDLEGSLRRVVAHAQFTNRPITLELTKQALRDLLMVQEKLINIENIKKVTVEYYNIRMADLTSKKRTRSIARPRQMAMYLAKQLTKHSLPEIGDAFGGRDHTTVLHACKTIKALIEEDPKFQDDHSSLVRKLTF